MSMTKGRTKLGVDYVRDNGSFKLKGVYLRIKYLQV